MRVRVTEQSSPPVNLKPRELWSAGRPPDLPLSGYSPHYLVTQTHQLAGGCLCSSCQRKFASLCQSLSGSSNQLLTHCECSLLFDDQVSCSLNSVSISSALSSSPL